MKRACKVAILDETGPDESFLVGTRDQFETLLLELRALLETKGVERNIRGIDVEVCSSGRLTESMAHTCFDSIFIVNSEEDRKRFVSASLEACGDEPIDWDAVEEDFEKNSRS